MENSKESLIKIPNVDVSKQTIAFESNRIIEAVENGEIDPVKLIAYLAAMDKVFKNVRADIMSDAVDEFQRYNERTITVLGNVEISQTESSIRYDFKNTEHWNEIKARENEIVNERKRFESTLKTLKHPGAMTTEDGELIDVNPPIKESSTILKVVIK